MVSPAGRVGDWINHHIRKGGEIGKSVIVGWAYVKELAVTNTRERGIEIIKLYTRGKYSEGRRRENVYGQRIREKCDQCLVS